MSTPRKSDFAHDLGTAMLAITEAVAILPDLANIAKTLKKMAAEAQAAAMLAVANEGLHPDRLYTKKQAAAFLGRAVSTVNNQPRNLLPVNDGRIMGFSLWHFVGKFRMMWPMRTQKNAHRRSCIT